MIDPFQNKMVDVAVATCTHSYYRLAPPSTLSCWYRPTAFGQSLKRLGWRLLGRSRPIKATTDTGCPIESGLRQIIHRIAERGRICGTKRKRGNRRNPHVDWLPAQGATLGPAD